MTTTQEWGFTDHVMERLDEFYPGADECRARFELTRSLHLEPPSVLLLAGRHESECTYHLHRERTGIFVVAADAAVVTFLRFYSREQHEAASSAHPRRAPLTTFEPSWATDVILDALGPSPSIRVDPDLRKALGMSLEGLSEHVRFSIARGCLGSARGWPPYQVAAQDQPAVRFGGILWIRGAPIGVLVRDSRICLEALPKRTEPKVENREGVDAVGIL